MGILIGLDIGTTKLCAVALEADTGALKAAEVAANDTRLPSESDAAEQDPRAIVARSIELLKRLTSRTEVEGHQALAIGVTGQMHGVVLADADGYPITPLIFWQDARGNRRNERTGRTYSEELAYRLGPDALEACGCAPAAGYGAVTLLRMREEGALPEKATALTIHDLMVRTLCGSAVTDPTDAASWGVFDARDGARWLPGVREAMGIPEGVRLPDVRPTGSLAGRVPPEIAAATGLPEGLPVAVALGDNQASFLGSVPSLDETLLLNLGTGGQMSVPVGSFIRAGGLDTRPLVAGQWLLVGASLCGGRAYGILHDFFAGVGGEFFDAACTAPLYDIMNRLAAEAEDDCGGLTASTLFDGSRIDPLARGAIAGVDTANLTPGNVARAVIKGMVSELVEFYRLARDCGADAKLLAGSGNAVRRNPVAREEIERQIGMPLRMPPHQEEAAVGAALVAGVAAGVYKDWRAAGRALFKQNAG